MNGIYQECPNTECQGLIAPEASHTSPSRTVNTPEGVTTSRTTLIWCETCRTAFEIITTRFAEPRIKISHQDADPMRVALIRRRIVQGNRTKQQPAPAKQPKSRINCYA